MAYTVTNNPWTSQYSVGIGTEAPGTNLEVFGTDAEMMVHYTGNSRGGFRAMSTQRLAILSTASSDNLVFGYETDFKSTFTERMRIVNSTGNVGIGTTSPSTILNVASSAPTIRLNPTTQNNATAIEFGVLNAGNNAYAKIDATNTQNYDTNLRFFTNEAGSFTQVERMRIDYSGNVGIGASSPSSLLHLAGGGTGTRGALRISEAGLTNYWELGRDNTVSGDFTINSNATERMRVTTAGAIGVGTTTPGTYKLNVNGTFYSAGSSLEYKTDITTLDIDTNKILELRPVTYQYKDEYKHLGKELKSGTQIGLIAEEVAEVFPELAMMKEDEDGETRVRNVDYEKLSILLLSEVQKLRKEVNELKNK